MFQLLSCSHHQTDPKNPKIIIIPLQYCSETSDLTPVLYKAHNVYNTGMRRITTFLSTTNLIYDGGTHKIMIKYNIIL